MKDTVTVDDFGEGKTVPTLAGKPKTPLNARCGGCQHIWPALYLPMPLTSAAKVMGSINCPACGNGPSGIFVATETRQT